MLFAAVVLLAELVFMAEKKVPFVDKGACIGCGACVAICSKVFEFDADNKAEAVHPDAASESEIQAAIDGCPVSAISWKKK